jgi:hypothetical protein
MRRIWTHDAWQAGEGGKILPFDADRTALKHPDRGEGGTEKG